MRRSGLLLIILCLHACWLSAQDTGRIAQPSAENDTAISPFVQKVMAAGERDQAKSRTTYEAGKVAIRQRAVWEALIRTAHEVKLYLGKDINPKMIRRKLSDTRKTFGIIQDGIFTNKGTAQTERNLQVSATILYEVMGETEQQKALNDKYYTDLTRYRNQIDSLLSDPAVYTFPKDSVGTLRYLQRLRVIVQEGNPVDNALNDMLTDMQALQNETDSLLFVMQVAYEQIDAYRNRIAHIHLQREFANLWQPVGYSRPFSEILKFSIVKERLALGFYLRDNILKLVLLVIIVVMGYTGLRTLRQKASDQRDGSVTPASLQRPLAATLLVILSIYQFVFINAPFIFSVCLWLVCTFCLYVLLRGYVTAFWLRFWTVLSTLFLLACMNNFILQASRTERWLIALLSLAGAAYGLFILSNRHRQELREKSILLFIRFFVAMEALSFLANLFGRYNLSKSMLIAGYTGVVTAILFLWVARYVNEVLRTGSLAYRHPERGLFYINFNRIGDRAPRVLYILLVVGWLILTGRNFYAFKQITVPFQAFLHEQRTLGDYSFSINSLFLFLFIALCSLMLSRIISIFAADPQATHNSNTSGKVAMGSWILLIRIFIICMGLFLAFAASGLPLDKLTIVLGALGVGIGLGLQGLVSNLVSGLIIAFERPVNVGDVIEVKGRSGRMKSIGFRSSIVALNDGSSMVVPNGDLLNEHLINWSLSRSGKQLSIAISVAGGSDLPLVKQLLEDTVKKDEKIATTPAPVAVAQAFHDNAVTFELICWVRRPADAALAKGNAIIAIDSEFKRAGITLAIPQQELHLQHNTTNGGTQHPPATGRQVPPPPGA